MLTFTTPREMRLWLYALVVVIIIFSTLAFGRPLQNMLRNQDVQAVFFVTGMVLTAATIVAHGLRSETSNAEIVAWIGFAMIYVMLIFRLGAPERSHVMEYSILAIFIFTAMKERWSNSPIIKPAFYAFITTVSIGIIDEGIQWYLPERVFDIYDMIFNGMAAFIAIGGSLIIQWIRRKFSKET